METTNPAAFGAIIVAIVIPVMVVMWVAVTGLLASMSGWPDLADTFPARERPRGTVLKRSVFIPMLVAHGVQIPQDAAA